MGAGRARARGVVAGSRVPRPLLPARSAERGRASHGGCDGLCGRVGARPQASEEVSAGPPRPPDPAPGPPARRRGPDPAPSLWAACPPQPPPVQPNLALQPSRRPGPRPCPLPEASRSSLSSPRNPEPQLRRTTAVLNPRQGYRTQRARVHLGTRVLCLVESLLYLPLHPAPSLPPGVPLNLSVRRRP